MVAMLTRFIQKLGLVTGALGALGMTITRRTRDESILGGLRGPKQIETTGVVRE